MNQYTTFLDYDSALMIGILSVWWLDEYNPETATCSVGNKPTE